LPGLAAHSVPKLNHETARPVSQVQRLLWTSRGRSL
jgi:hypothetical protein